MNLQYLSKTHCLIKTAVPGPKTATTQKLVSQMSQVPNFLSGGKPYAYEIFIGKEAADVRSCAIHRAWGMNPHAHPGAMMNLNNQVRQKDLERRKDVILSAAKDLGAGRIRSFAALRMTLPAFIVKGHDRSITTFLLNDKSSCLNCPKSQTLRTDVKTTVPSLKLRLYYTLSQIAGPPCGGVVTPYVVARGGVAGMWGPCGCQVSRS
jgi:hypothetical protein